MSFNKSRQWIIIPQEEDSFYHKLAVKYNEVLDEIKELEEGQEELSLLDKYHAEKLKNFKDTYIGIFEKKLLDLGKMMSLNCKSMGAEQIIK